MNSLQQALQAGLTRLQLPLDQEKIVRLAAFGQAVVEKNQVMNLTAITQPQAVAELHLLDSLTLLKVLPLAGKTVLDIGTGAGFPGVALKLAEPTLHLTLLDSLQKRMRWLKTEALPALGVEAEIWMGRAEEFALAHRESFQVVTARAVARLPLLCELCLPFVQVGGHFLAMKGADAAQELAQAQRAVSLLGGKHVHTHTFTIGGACHQVLVIEKIRPTPAAYPRSYGKIKQKPL